MISSKINKPQKNQVIFLAVLIAIITINCGKITTASDELIGIWKTSNIRYNDTSFEIKKKAITFHTKEGDSNKFTIIKIKKELMQDKEWVQYTIFYCDRDLKKVEFPFYFRSSDSSVIRFKNQPYLVWKKESGIKT
jgi:hypothetical protein